MSAIQIRSGSTLALIEPDVGFNLYSFVVDGYDYIHRELGFPQQGKPTHSGTPILFPWPNRIASAHFSWEGTDYSLPFTEPATGASIHGYATDAAWQVIDSGPDHATGEYVLPQDEAHPWPAAGSIRVTYRVEPTALLVSTMVANTSDVDLPFGVGFHPYFRVPGPFDQWLLQCDAGESWPLTSMVPSGSPVPVGPDLDFRTPRRLGNQHLDDALTGLPPTPGMTKRAALMSMAATVSVSSDEAFGEYVLFTPGSRDAVAIEPYTCATDAVNLAARGISAGWRALPPGETATFHWRVDVE
jgi:aldose 1-epimerase